MPPSIHQVVVSELMIFPTDGGSVLRGLKRSDPGFSDFGEAYFSSIDQGTIRGWKRHQNMTLNLIVPVGEIRFVLIDGRDSSPSNGKVDDIILSTELHYARLTVPPGIWLAFQGLGKPNSLLLNIANIEHDPLEVDQKALDEFDIHW